MFVFVLALILIYLDHKAVLHESFSRVQAANEPHGFHFLLKTQPCDVAVLLAGTNDLGQPPTDSRLPREDEIAQHVWGLHAFAHARSIRTVAVAVPPSHYQAAVPAAAALRAQVNAALRAKCDAATAAAPGLCTYVPFPFAWSAGSPLWEADGLHLTAAGYDALGDALAPFVRQALAVEAQAALPAAPGAEDAAAAEADPGAPARLYPGASKPFPAHWGEPPRVQTRDYREWPAGYGVGSGSVGKWVAENMAKDAAGVIRKV